MENGNNNKKKTTGAPPPFRISKWNKNEITPSQFDEIQFFLNDSIRYYGLPSFTGFLMGFTEFYWVLLRITGRNRVLLDLMVIYQVLLGFTGFYWVLPSFT